ncbi:hypothetical protein [Asticcacaulis solisilvae]|uniref:hypothetical protein n=1 Tax=Asticcacaulis solisilvae TaxID=1217274 RepID=UPI003FD82657
MKFPSPLRAPEGLTSYARTSRVRPVHLAINLFEGLLALLGVVVLILLIRYGSFEKAGLAIDGGIDAVRTFVLGLAHAQKA